MSDESGALASGKVCGGHIQQERWIGGLAACIGPVMALTLACMPRQADVPAGARCRRRRHCQEPTKAAWHPHDIRMWFAIYNKGGGDPVLLVHGGTSNAETRGNQVPVLMRNHEVILGESRGHGRSTRSDPTPIN